MGKNNSKKKMRRDESLIRIGSSALAKGRFKEAVNSYKQLLKQDPKDQWRECLAEAYLGRAKQLAAKELYKEAVSTLENRQAVVDRVDTHALQIIWLFFAGKPDQAANHFNQHWEDLKADEIEQIEALFALAIASGQDELLRSLPDGSKVKAHAPIMNAAIGAYCQGDDAKLSELLKNIPYRSPYRDLRIILSALAESPDNYLSGREKLEKISQVSPFKRFALLSKLAINKEFDMDELGNLSLAAQSYIGTIRGVDQRFFKFTNKIVRAKGSAKAMFKTLLNDSPQTGNENVEQFCYSLLPHFPAGVKIYQQHFAPLTEFELCNVGALAFEINEDFESAAWEWEAAAQALAKTPETEKRRLMRAMLLRRAGECADRNPNIFSEHAEEFLEKSIECDPGDLPTYLNLFKRYKDSGDDAAYRDCVNRAVKQFPEDSEVLMAAIELAIDRNTFKKATKLAQTLLKRDSINNRARTLLINAHLSHAGKQILKSRFDLAAKEIDEAEKTERSGNPTGLVPLYRGILKFAENDVVRGDQLIEEACQRLESYPRGYLRTIVELSRFGLSPRYSNKYESLLKNVASKAPDKKTFIGLIKDIQRYLEDDEIDISKPFGAVKKYISASVSLDFNRDEMELICATFEKLAAYQHLLDFASTAVNFWPKDPIFEYYFVFAKTKGYPAEISPADYQCLQEALDRATEQSNIRAIRCLVHYLDSARYFPGFGSPEISGDGVIFDEGDEPESESNPANKPRKNQRRRKDPFTLDLFDDQSV